ncbi:MAG: hypothetical protein ACUVWP_05420 [bacterium]
MHLFTRGEKIEGVESFDWKKGGEKWRRIYIKDMGKIKDVIEIIRKSYNLIKEAIKKNGPTGWYASIEEDIEEENLEELKR